MSASINASQFISNKGRGGGALHSQYLDALNITHTLFSGNQAAQWGAGVFSAVSRHLHAVREKNIKQFAL